MSQEMVEKKKAELEAIEAENTETEKAMENDKCTMCHTPTNDFPYVMMLPPPMGWMECPFCGAIFVPESIRKEKLNARKKGGGKGRILLPT